MLICLYIIIIYRYVDMCYGVRGGKNILCVRIRHTYGAFSDLPRKREKNTDASLVTDDFSTTGNSAGRRVTSRRSAMATPPPSTPLPAAATAASSAVSHGAFDPCGLASVSPPPPPKLSREQLKQCSEALSFFKNKLKNMATVAQEFGRLQVIF
jgi:hypothetical protein